MTTPAQAYGHPEFVTDVPVQGPTDEGMRAASCWHVQHNLPTTRPACVDCKGPIPMWAQSGAVGVGEQLSFSGVGMPGFALLGPNDPEIWSKLNSDQQMWVSNTLNKLNTLIMSQSGTSCPTWGPAINLAGGCFQVWYNHVYGPSLQQMVSPSKTLRTDGVFDEDTLCALVMVAGIHAADFPTPFPDPGKQYCQVSPASPTKKLSTAAMVGIGTAGAVAVGGIAYALSKSGRKGRR